MFSCSTAMAVAPVEQEQYLQATLDTVVSNFGGDDIIEAVCIHINENEENAASEIPRSALNGGSDSSMVRAVLMHLVRRRYHAVPDRQGEARESRGLQEE